MNLGVVGGRGVRFVEVVSRAGKFSEADDTCFDSSVRIKLK